MEQAAETSTTRKTVSSRVIIRVSLAGPSAPAVERAVDYESVALTRAEGNAPVFPGGGRSRGRAFPLPAKETEKKRRRREDEENP